jgi:hypothetical protein
MKELFLIVCLGTVTDENDQVPDTAQALETPNAKVSGNGSNVGV